jgi:DNA repair protein RadC
MKVENEVAAEYVVGDVVKIDTLRWENDLVDQALAILRGRMVTVGISLTSPQVVKEYLTLKLAEREREVFGVMLVNAQNKLIHDEELFAGTLSQTSVFPREVVKLALEYNAHNVVLYHNHPSGLAEPSRADEFLTTTLKSALALIDVRVLDHIIVGGMTTMSFAEKGLL